MPMPRHRSASSSAVPVIEEESRAIGLEEDEGNGRLRKLRRNVLLRRVGEGPGPSLVLPLLGLTERESARGESR